MKAVIRSFYCSESEDLSSYEADELPNFSFQLTFAIGPDNGEGEDLFEVLVASAKYLAQHKSAQTPTFLRHVILAPDYNIPAVVVLVEKYISSLEEATWYELANKINRVIRWEFEDYRIA